MASVTSRSAASPSKNDDGSPTIKFTNVRDLFDILNSERGDFLRITRIVVPSYFYMVSIPTRHLDVSPGHFADIEREREKRRRRVRFRHESSTQNLQIKLPTDLHETLHIELYEGYCFQHVRSGREESWQSMGATTRRAGQARPGGHFSSGEGDATGGPWSERGFNGAWPTLVVEAGMSQPSDSETGLLRLGRWFEHHLRRTGFKPWCDSLQSITYTQD
jgi:hypothetical protein